MWLFGGLWNRWTLAFRIATPILHVVFTMAQLWGAIVMWRMWKQQSRLLAEENENGKPTINQEEADIPKPDKATLRVLW